MNRGLTEESEKIRKVKDGEEADSGMEEGTREDGEDKRENDREATTIDNGRIGGCLEVERANLVSVVPVVLINGRSQ